MPGDNKQDIELNDIGVRLGGYYATIQPDGAVSWGTGSIAHRTIQRMEQITKEAHTAKLFSIERLATRMKQQRAASDAFSKSTESI